MSRKPRDISQGNEATRVLESGSLLSLMLAEVDGRLLMKLQATVQ